MATTTVLTPGQRVAVDPTLNSSGFVATVESVQPWIITAGANAGQQATNGRQGKGVPLFSVSLVDATRTAPSLRPIAADSTAGYVDSSDVRDMAVTADAEWMVTSA